MSGEPNPQLLDNLERHVKAKIDDVAESEMSSSQYDDLQRKAIKSGIMEVFEQFLADNSDDVGAAKAVAAAKRHGTGAGTGGDPFVSSQDRADAIKGTGSGTESGSAGESAVAKSQSSTDRKAATAMLRKRHNANEQSKTFASPDPFDAREYEQEIRETADSLRRLKVLRGNASPRNTDERYLANLEGDERKRAVAMQNRQLPDVDMSTDGGAAAAVKSYDGPSDDDGDLEWASSPNADVFTAGEY